MAAFSLSTTISVARNGRIHALGTKSCCIPFNNLFFLNDKGGFPSFNQSHATTIVTQSLLLLPPPPHRL